MKASWGALDRVTYLPVALRGERSVTPAPWVDSAEVFPFVTNDTQFAWSLIHEGSVGYTSVPPQSLSPALDAQRAVALAPGETAEANFVLGAGIEEFSAAHSAKALRELIDRNGASFMIDQAAAWCKRRTRTTGQPDLDVLMNRNFLFTALYAWGKTIDTEQVVGSRRAVRATTFPPRIGTEMRCCGASRDCWMSTRCWRGMRWSTR